MKYGLRFALMLSVMLFVLLHCSAPGYSEETEAETESVTEIRLPLSEGVTHENGNLLIDAANCSEGYFFAWVAVPTAHKLKLRVEKEGETLTYDLNGEGESEVFPLQLGDGEYTVTLYENVKKKSYALAGTVQLTVELSDEDSPFLYPNQYVHYTELSPMVEAMKALLTEKEGKEALEAVQDFMESEFAYDYIRSLTVQPGELPDADACFEARMGICQDLSAVVVSMLRMRGIPAKLVIGYADANYHAWTTAKVDDEDVFYDPTAALNAIAEPVEYTEERFY